MTFDAAIKWLPACLLMLIVSVYTLSYVSGRMVVVEGSITVLLLLPCLYLTALAHVRLCNGLVAWFIVTAVALEAWMAGVQLLRSDALPAGWWCILVRAAGLSTLVLMLGTHCDVRALVRVVGAAAACAVTVCALMNNSLGLLLPLCTDSFGFGHINILANTAGPALIAWLILTIGEWHSGRRPRPVELALLVIGLAALGVITVTTQRRGVMLGAGAASAWLAMAWLWGSHRRLAIALVITIGIALLLLAVHLMANGPPGLRAERVNLYRSGLEGVLAGLPWGFGHFGALHLQTVAGEACRHTIATGGYGDDIHNQILEAALDGGLVALLLMLVLYVLTAWRLLTIRDPVLRPALQAMGMAILMHLLTDNVYDTEVGLVWLSVAVGMMLSAPSAAATLPPLRWLPPLRHLAWPLAMLAAWGALIDLRPALLSTDAGAKSIYRCLQTVLVPQSVSMYTERIIESEDPWVDQARRTEALAMSVHTMGWTIRTALYGVEFARQADVPKQTVAAILRVLALNPFFKEYYEQLSAVLGAHPECERLLPKVVRLRLAYLGGDAHLPRPDLHVDPVRIDEAADLYAAIVWSFANDVHWKELEGSLHALCRRYGDIQGVAQLVVMARCAEPHQAIPWMDEVSPVLEVGLRAPGAMIAALSVASNAAQAQALLPLIEKLFPEIISDCRSGTMHEVHDPLGIALRNGIVRLWGQARSLPAREAGR